MSAVGFSIDGASERDVPHLAAIDKACFPERTTDPAAELERPWARVWVARTESDHPIGFLLVWFVADEMHVLTLATLAEFRRLGVGRSLMEHGLGEARAHGTRLVILEVRRSNQPAICLYRALGFEDMGVRHHYYTNGEDALEMGLVLEAGTGERDRGRG